MRWLSLSNWVAENITPTDAPKPWDAQPIFKGKKTNATTTSLATLFRSGKKIQVEKDSNSRTKGNDWQHLTIAIDPFASKKGSAILHITDNKQRKHTVQFWVRQHLTIRDSELKRSNEQTYWRTLPDAINMTPSPPRSILGKKGQPATYKSNLFPSVVLIVIPQIYSLVYELQMHHVTMGC